MKISLFTAEEKHLLTRLDVSAECFPRPLVAAEYRDGVAAYPGDPSVGGPGSEYHYWVRHNSARTCQNHLSAPLQRTPSQYTRSQCGGLAWPGEKAGAF